MVLDESHYIKNRKAQRSTACVDLSKAPSLKLRLALTGTPVLNRPEELLNQLSYLGRLNDLGGFWGFAKRYCDAREGRHGWDFSGAAYLEELGERLRSSCFVRREKKDVAKELPPLVRTTVAMELDDMAAYRAAEQDVIGWLREQKAARAAAAGKDTFDEGSYSVAALAKIEGLKQLTVKHKLDSCIEWVRNFCESDGKLVVFAHHRDVQKALLANLSEFNPAKISGDDTDEGRAAEIKRFWDDPACKLMVASLKAGNVGINLQVASSVAFVEFGWTSADHDQAEARCHRIGTEASSVNSYWLAASGTFDEGLIDIIQSKREIVETINSGEGGSSTSTLSALTALLTK